VGLTRRTRGSAENKHGPLTSLIGLTWLLTCLLEWKRTDLL